MNTARNKETAKEKNSKSYIRRSLLKVLMPFNIIKKGDVIMVRYKENLIGIENHLALMTLYRDEWKHRDQMFVSFFWRFLYLSLVITFLPNFLKAFNIEADIVNALPIWLFSIAGIGCSILGLYLGLAENKRITEVDLAYKKVAASLPHAYQVKKITEKYYAPRLNVLLCWVSYSITIFLAICNFAFSL